MSSTPGRVPPATPFHWVEGLTPSPLQGMRLGTNETVLPDAAVARRQFERFRGVAFESSLSPAFLQQVLKLCDTGTFISDVAQPGHREVEAPQRAGRALNLVLSRPPILRWLEEVTGSGPLREIAGRVVQTVPRPGDELRWHDDRPGHDPVDDRRLALVINLGSRPFTGGQFELRPKGGELLLQHQHTVTGSMLVFRVREDLEHRVLPLTAGGPRRVFTGWAMGAIAS